MRTKLGLFLALGLLTACVTGRADPLAVGAKAPAVTGITETGAKLDFSSVYPKGYTLVYFFPQAEGRECTVEGCTLAGAYKKLECMGVTVIGVSVDDQAAQKAFKEKNKFPFTLISDVDHTVINAFGVPLSEQWGTGLRAMRESFLINKDGKVVWRNLKVSPKDQPAEVMKAVQQACGGMKAKGAACPAMKCPAKTCPAMSGSAKTCPAGKTCPAMATPKTCPAMGAEMTCPAATTAAAKPSM
jgi:peroxiredoxin Q/BCP